MFLRQHIAMKCPKRPGVSQHHSQGGYYWVVIGLLLGGYEDKEAEPNTPTFEKGHNRNVNKN